MSTPGKIFVVLNLILAALFLGWAANNLSAAENYRMRYEDENAAYLAFQQEKESELGSLREEYAQLEQARSSLRNERDDLDAEAKRVAAQLQAAQEKNAQLDADIASIKSSLDAINETSSRNSERVQEMAASLQEAMIARRDAEDARETALEAQRAAQEALAARENALADLEREREGLRRQVSDLDAELSTLVDTYNVPRGQITAMPQINGSVLQVETSIDPPLIAINRGSQDGVQRGFTFEIYNGNQYKGQVRVENVEENMCTAVILRTVDGRAIRAGDQAATRI